MKQWRWECLRREESKSSHKAAKAGRETERKETSQ